MCAKINAVFKNLSIDKSANSQFELKCSRMLEMSCRFVNYVNTRICKFLYFKRQYEYIIYCLRYLIITFYIKYFDRKERNKSKFIIRHSMFGHLCNY